MAATSQTCGGKVPAGKADKAYVIDSSCRHFVVSTSSKLSILSRAERLAYATALSDGILQTSWSSIIKSHRISRSKHGLKGLDIYTGVAGLALLVLKRYEALKVEADLRLAYDIIRFCEDAWDPADDDLVSFVMGKPGIWALGAVVCKLLGLGEPSRKYCEALIHYGKSKYLQSPDLPCEILYGRAGFLYACLFVNGYCGASAVPENVWRPIVDVVIAIGLGAAHDGWPLYYTWHGKPYLGAAHGICGICNILLQFPLSESQFKDVLSTVDQLLAVRFSSKNLPSSIGKERDELVQWCHGATGLVMTLCTAYHATNDKRFLDAALESAQPIISRGLLTKLGICHGIAGSIYGLRILQQSMQVSKLYDAAVCDALSEPIQKMESFLMFDPGAPAGHAVPEVADSHWRQLVDAGVINGGDRWLSLFEGAAGVACLMFDMDSPCFPSYQVKPPL